mmetsp:Transcript_20117/g.28309  ORF Transcript_20117/g.28309 Transcript_20117/m.28309 type:complete len:332 (+) Transcript_20117:243-1238(+)
MKAEEKTIAKHFGRYLNWSFVIITLTVTLAELVQYLEYVNEGNIVDDTWPTRKANVIGAIVCSGTSLFLALMVWISHLFPNMKRKYISLGKELVVGLLVLGQVCFISFVALRPANEIATSRLGNLPLVTITNGNLFFSVWGSIISLGSTVGSILGHYATLTEDIEIPSAKHNTEWMFLIFVGMLVCIICAEIRIATCKDVNLETLGTQDIVDITEAYCRKTTFGLVVGIISLAISTFAASMGSRGLVESVYNLWTSAAFMSIFIAALCSLTAWDGPANNPNDIFFVLWIGLFMSSTVFVTSILEMRMTKFVNLEEEDHLTYDGDDSSIIVK